MKPNVQKELLTAPLAHGFCRLPLPPRYLLYRALGALVPYIVGTWEIRDM